MIRNFLSEVVQKKYFVMFFTSVIYIIGLFAYFGDFAVLAASVLLILGVFAIVKNYMSPKLVLFWYFVFFFGFFNASLRIKNSDVLYQLSPQEATITGQVTSIPASNIKDRTKFFLNVSDISYAGKNEKTKAKTYVTVYANDGDFSKFNIGDTYKIKGKLRTPFKVGNPSQFDYGRYLRNFNTFTLFYADQNDCIKQDVRLAPRWAFLQGLNNIRNGIIQTHSKYLKSPNIEILGGIVFGDDAISPPDYIKQAFLNSGLLHILAASGMNVAIVYGIWFFILNKFKVPFNVIVSSGIFMIIFYALMTGLGPSVIRAMFMLIFILLGKLIDRDAHSISLLSFVALLMLIYNPAYINDVGFQLSFLVTFGLLTTAPVVFERIKFMPNWLSGAIFIPIVAQIWVAPIQMFYFNTFSLYSVFANIAIMPFVSIVSFGGFISSVLALIKPIASPVCFVFDFVLNPVLNCLVFISEYFAKLPHSLISTTQPSVLQVFLYYGIVFAITLLLKLGKDKKFIFATCALFVVLILSTINIPNKNFETIAFDVQNADAFLIKTPENKYFLIDSAKSGYKGAKSPARAIILEYLKDRGIKDIEGFIITHFDNDHSGGAVDLMQNLRIKRVYINSYNDKSRTSEKIYSYLKSHKNISVDIPRNNQVIYSEPNFKIKLFEANLRGKKSENENSIITLVSNNKFDELFMGDAGTTAFEKIQNYLPNNIEVLKVGHHGAKNVVNKRMLDKINPKFAIVSTGPNNYGHPNGVTLNILETHKVKTFRTDIQNSIKVVSSPEVYNIQSYNKSDNKYNQKTSDINPL